MRGFERGGRLRWLSTLLPAAVVLAGSLAGPPEPRWTLLSSTKGDLPSPAGSSQQTGALVAYLSKGRAADIVISYRVHAPALVWMRGRSRAGRVTS